LLSSENTLADASSLNGQTELLSPQISDINHKVPQLDLGTANLDDVISIFGEPTRYHWSGRTCTKGNLPGVYIAQYPDDFGVVMLSGRVHELRFESGAAAYVFRDTIHVGSWLREVVEVMGQPTETVIRQPCAWADGVLYKDIDGHATTSAPNKMSTSFSPPTR